MVDSYSCCSTQDCCASRERRCYAWVQASSSPFAIRTASLSRVVCHHISPLLGVSRALDGCRSTRAAGRALLTVCCMARCYRDGECGEDSGRDFRGHARA